MLDPRTGESVLAILYSAKNQRKPQVMSNCQATSRSQKTAATSRYFVQGTSEVG